MSYEVQRAGGPNSVQPSRKLAFINVRNQLENIILKVCDTHNIPAAKLLREVNNIASQMSGINFHDFLTYNFSDSRVAVTRFLSDLDLRSPLHGYIYRAFELMGIKPKEVDPRIDWEFPDIEAYYREVKKQKRVSSYMTLAQLSSPVKREENPEMQKLLEENATLKKLVDQLQQTVQQLTLENSQLKSQLVPQIQK